MDFAAFNEALSKIPFSRHIPEDRRLAWYQFLLEQNDHPPSWHLRRLGNEDGVLIGGSEIGILLAADLGVMHPFGATPLSLFNAKLLREWTRPNAAMTRGRELEPQAIAALLQSRKHWVVDEQAMQGFAKARFGAPTDHLAYSPDLIVKDVKTQERILVDTKVPYGRNDPAEVPVHYWAQLQQGMLLGKILGFPMDWASLVYYHHHQGENPRLVVFDRIAPDPQVWERLRRLGRDFADHVDRGVAPLPVSEERRSAIIEALRQWSHLQRKAVEAKSAAEAFAKTLVEDLSGYTFSEIKAMGIKEAEPGVVIRQTLKVEQGARLEQRLREHGFDPRRFRSIAPGDFDPQRVEQALRAAGLSDSQIDALRGDPKIDWDSEAILSCFPEAVTEGLVRRQVVLSLAPASRRSRTQDDSRKEPKDVAGAQKLGKLLSPSVG